MTDEHRKAGRGSLSGPSSTLAFDPAHLMAMRVRPAQFAKMCGVSKQAVSQWVKRGTISLFPDGTLDPVRASREVLDNSDPARLQARIFKRALQDPGELRRTIRELEQTVETLSAQLAAERNRATDEQARRVFNLCAVIEDRFEALVQAETAGELENLLEQLCADCFGWAMPETDDADTSSANAVASPENSSALKAACAAPASPEPPAHSPAKVVAD